MKKIEQMEDVDIANIKFLFYGILLILNVHSQVIEKMNIFTNLITELTVFVIIMLIIDNIFIKKSNEKLKIQIEKVEEIFNKNVRHLPKNGFSFYEKPKNFEELRGFVKNLSNYEYETKKIFFIFSKYFLINISLTILLNLLLVPFHLEPIKNLKTAFFAVVFVILTTIVSGFHYLYEHKEIKLRAREQKYTRLWK